MNSMTDVTYHNDAFEYDPDLYSNYEAPTGNKDPELVQPGLYRVRVLSGGQKCKRDGTPIEITDKKTGEKCPILVINRIELLEPEEFSGMSYGVFTDVFTTNLEVRDRVTGEPVPGKWIVDGFRVLAAIDRGLMTPSYDENVKELRRQLAELKPTLTVRLAYEGFDTDFYKAQTGQGVPDKQARKSATVKSQAFKNSDGSYRHQTPGPSGADVRAKLVIKEFIPDGAPVELGPFRSRR